MPPSHLPEDRTGPPGPGPAEQAPSPTRQWRARVALEKIHDLLAAIKRLPAPRPLLRQRATDIAAEVDNLTGSGKVDIRDVERLEELHGELAALHQGHDQVGVIAPPAQPLNTRPAGHLDVHQLDTDILSLAQVIRGERAHLPEVSRWPWRNRRARRRVRSWHTVYRLIEGRELDEVDWPAAKSAWQAYCALLKPQPTSHQPQRAPVAQTKSTKSAATYATSEGA